MLEKAKKALEETLENKKMFLPLDLQLFAEGDDGGAGEGQEGGEGSGDDNGEGQGEEGQEGGSEGSGEGSKSKSFTQDDVNAIAAREAKKAQEKLLKQLGVKDFKSAKDGLEQFKKITDAQKTDADKALEQLNALKEENGTLSSTVGSLTAQLAALKAGVNTESLDDVIVLANNLVNDDTNIDDAIVQVLTKYPHFKAVQTEKQEDKKQKPKFTDGEHKNKQKQSEGDAWMNAFNFGGTVK